MGIDDSILLIVGKPQGIFNQQLRPHAINMLNIIIILINNIKLFKIKLFLSTEEEMDFGGLLLNKQV